MATKLFLRSTQNNGIGSTYFDMTTAAGSSSTTAATTTTASGDNIPWTQTAGGSEILFISGRAPSGGFTLTTTDISIWAHESGTGVNTGGGYRLFKRDSLGIETELLGGQYEDGVEFTKTTPTEMTWAGNPTDTIFLEDDRILLKLFAVNVGTMGAGTVTLTYNGADAATGDSFLNIAETVTFKPESQALTPGLFTDDDTFFAPVVASTYTLTPDLFTDDDTFFAPAVTSVYPLTPDLFTDSDVFHAPTVTAGPVDIAPGLFSDGDTFFAPTIAATYGLAPGLFTNDNTFFSPTVSAGAGAQDLQPGLFTNESTFFPPTVATAAEAVVAQGGGDSSDGLWWRSPRRRKAKGRVGTNPAEATEKAEESARMPVSHPAEAFIDTRIDRLKAEIAFEVDEILRQQARLDRGQRHQEQVHTEKANKQASAEALTARKRQSAAREKERQRLAEERLAARLRAIDDDDAIILALSI